MDFLRRTWAEIDISSLIHNLKEIKNAVENKKIFAVVKADAYGHYAEFVAPALEKEGVYGFAVSNLIEAEQLRDYGIKSPILILGYTPVEFVERLALGDIIQTVYSKDYAEMLSLAATKHDVTIKVHIKLDTGMGRIGFDCRTDELLEISSAIKSAGLPNFILDGVFTHFAVADRTENEEDGFTDEQNNRFNKAKEAFLKAGFKDVIFHTANSAATLLDYDKHYGACRTGIILYGLTPNNQLNLKEKLIPVMSFKTVVTMVKTVKQGDTISYGRTFTAEKKMRLASIAVGYADGYPRAMSNKGYVIINGKKAKIVGRVCMDQTVVDVSGIDDVKIGDEVLLFGKDLPVEEIAEISGTINYEIITNISPRVPRVRV